MEKTKTFNELKLWGGIECTINRVGDEYKDQLAYSAHYDRIGDLEAIAAIGIRTIRYPVLWDKHQPKRDSKIDWRWTDKQLERLRMLNINAIIGLLHHGSGPSFTHLLDPDFPYLLAAYAYEVASRYPWIRDYTPVNEPLTTARFSGLYGLWYPHHCSELSFYRMLLNQLRGTVLAMEAIRSVNPAARLIQTEDLGKTYSTPLLAYQARFENDRRLLTFDILAGRMRPGHPQYDYMLGCGIRKEELDFFQAHQSPPDVMGLNYYVTSERWLDESIEKYDHHTHGGNGIHRYADTEVVRANPPAWSGFKKLAREIWERYQIPMAVTEVHLHCTREEQMRWFYEIWKEAQSLIREGVAVKGVTAWALLGSFDWDTLLTKTGSQYESGVFDIRTFAKHLRPTALAELLKTLANKKNNFHPVLSEPGWWHPASQGINFSGRPILILTDDVISGLQVNQVNHLLSLFIDACDQRRIPNKLATSLNEETIERESPWSVINLMENETDAKTICKRWGLSYVCFSGEESQGHCLQIILEERALSIHQVNRILDLLIDGERGCWIFGPGQIVVKRKSLMGSPPFA